MTIIVTIINIIIAIVLKLVQLILLPFDLLINNFIPELASGLDAIGDFLVIMAQGIGWAISVSGIPYFAISLLASAMIFNITLPFNVWFVKMALNWYHTLKP